MVVFLVVLIGLVMGIAVVRKLLELTTAMVPTAHANAWPDANNVDQAASQFDVLRNAWSGKYSPWDGVNRLKAIDTNGGL